MNEKNKEDSFVRQKMKDFWESHEPSLESMLLCHDTIPLANDDRKEILSYLPNYQGKKVLELGAGIGRFTCKLASVASHVTAVDFNQTYITENHKHNHHLGNVTFTCADVTELDLPTASFDLVFSNWLFMYLSDNECAQVLSKILSWLTPDGYLFFRESCYKISGNMVFTENPSLLRSPLHYYDMLRDASSNNFGFKIIRSSNTLAYIKYNSNPNQLCFLSKLVQRNESDDRTRYLESHYAVDTIKSMDRIYGYNWYSTGGEHTTRDFCARLGLLPGQKVLDVGCGTGGSATFMARHYGVHVHGVDLSTNMIHVAIERLGRLEAQVIKRIQFEVSDILEAEREKDSYDLIYSRDCILYITDKQQVFRKLYDWLRPGGTLFVTDFCRTNSHPPNSFLHYASNVKYYCLETAASYVEAMTEAGFEDVKAEDLQQEFIKILESELKAFVATRQAFLREHSQQQFDDIFKSWTDKIRWTREGELTWTAFTAHKTSARLN
ncbi:hypothetical protein OTU49_011066 [Cherax quadricarinatus]|uniref:phosphoethanolamine N-methyltransferase n=2 Tax=Cherax quadricarinatus TaxID=27406 RepID=A0AAW0W4T2_CHEQU|nr:uncharacterized protein LOC128703144 [Cherax quadricarinatus]